jgi:hypothetical protein
VLMRLSSLQTRSKIGLAVLVNFVLPLHVLFYFGAVNMYLDYALNLCYLSFFFLGCIELETDKREFRRLKLMKILPIPLYGYFIVTQVGYPFINMILGGNLPFFFLNFILDNVPNTYWVMVAISNGLNFLLIAAFIMFGFSNRKHYGNYIIAFAILYFADRLFYLITHVTASFNPTFYLLYLYSTFILGSISASYLIFFGQRIRTTYFTLGGITFFGALFVRWVFTFVFFIVAQIDIYSFIVLLTALIGVVISSRFIELGTTFKRGIRVFITHAVDDYSRYRINEIAQFLENQKGIRYVYYCESDLTGNIDAWMAKTVPRCQVLIFISTEKSLNSADCTTELSLARDGGLTIIPILGVGLRWDDLKKLNVHRDIGAKFVPMDFEDFCNQVYQQIEIYKKSLNQVPDSNQPEKKKDN